ncbi:hypothetical protein [Nonomuraea sp. NPDC049400]|uniref:hypothetical protein n=1 Tax=Nonomuraea sp. NPDC049400 TaxID=3364352 RepID=UPI0037BC3B76
MQRAASTLYRHGRSGTSRTILDEPMPFHRLGLTHTGYPPTDAATLGIDLDARPSYATVTEARAGRMALVRGIVDNLTDTELARMCTRAPAPGYPEAPRSVGSRLRVAMEEECSIAATWCATSRCSKRADYS